MSDDSAEGENSKEPFRQVIPSLLLLASVFLLNFISRIIFSPLLPEIQQDMQLAHSVAGSFFLFISAGYFISILLSGTVSSRLGHKWTIVVSAVGSGAMLSIVGFCTSVVAMRIAMFSLGYAAGLYLRSGLATITRLVDPAYLARGVAIHELAPNIGFVAAPLLSGLMLYYFSWREGLQILGLVLGCMGLIYALSGKGNGQNEKKKDLSLVRRLLVNPLFWLMVMLFSFAICSTLGIYAMLPLYLVTEHGMELDAANRLVSLSRVSSVFMPLVAGWFGDRFGNAAVMLIVLFLAGIFTIPLGIFTGLPLLVFVVLQPMVAVCFFPSGFAVLSGIGGREATGSAISLCIPVAFLIGGGAIPMVIGGVGDYYSLAAGFIGTGCFITSVAAVAFWVGQKKTLFQ